MPPYRPYHASNKGAEMATAMLSNMSTTTLPGGRTFLCLLAPNRRNIMTEIPTDETQETNGEDQAELRPVPLWERLEMTQEDYFTAAEQSGDNMRKLITAENKVQEAFGLLRLLRDADGNTTDDYDLSLRALYLLDRIQPLLKSAAKKIEKFRVEQHYRDVENWSKPRNLEYGTDRDAEQKELVTRLDALPKDEAMDVIKMYISLGLSKREGDEERRKEIFELLETQPVPWVAAYAYLADKGLVQVTPKADGADATAQ